MTLRSLAVFLFTIGGVAVAHAQDTSASVTPMAKIMTVATPDATSKRTFFGRVVAKETVDLAFQVGGQLVDFPVGEGDILSAGDLIAELDLEPFELSHDQAKAQLDQAQRTYDRLQKLQGSAASQVSVDDAKTQVELAEIALRNAERSLRMATLTAPFDTLVASRYSTNFSSIGAGSPVVRLHDMTEIRIEIDVPELLFQSTGTKPDVTLHAKFPASDTLFPVTIREYTAETSSIGQTFQITLGMTPPEDLVVLPGSSATVYAELKGPVHYPTLPISSIVTGNDGSTYVMVFEPAGASQGQVSKTAITIAPNSDGAIELRGGLEAGQEIIASGASRLNDGDTVRRFTGFSN